MGNIGRPSSGCFLCRKRRVKCDEARPSCRNCARLKKDCPGYRGAAFTHVDSHTIFVPAATRPTSQRSISFQDDFYREESSTRSSEDGSDSDAARSEPRLPSHCDVSRPILPLRNPPPDLIEQAICYSLKQIETDSRVLYGNLTFDFLPKMLYAAGQDSHLYSTMRCVAAVNLANRSPTVNMTSLKEFEYGQAVSRVTAALADPVQCLTDETLVAIWLLGIREILVGIHYPRGRLAYQTHIDGTLMLLEARGDEQFTRPESRHLYTTILSAMHWKALFIGEEPTEKYLFLESQLPRADPDIPTASMKLRAYFHGVTKLRARVKNYLCMVGEGSPIDRQHMVESYLTAGARLQDKAKGWCDIPNWLPRRFSTNEHQTPPRKSQKSRWTTNSIYQRHSFPSFDAFFHWNRYWVAKVCLHTALLDAIATLHNYAPLDELMYSHIRILQDIVDEFLGALAYAFGDIDDVGHVRRIRTPFLNVGASTNTRGTDISATMEIMAPLGYLMTLQYLAPGQREAMVSVLQRIQAEYSLR